MNAVGKSSELPHGWRLRWVAETGSTNSDLIEAGRRGEPDHTVLVADHQTAGRGRLDRRWEAPPGANLLASMLFRDVPDDPHELTQRVALAAVSAAREVADAHGTLKWPNDILVDDRKLAGVLAQRGDSPAGPFVVVGIGVNIGWAPREAARIGDGVTPREFLAAMLRAFDALPADVSALYRSQLATIGQRVRVDLADNRFITGVAIDVESDGRLVVLDDCALTHRIDTGDVVHLRPA